MFVRAAPTDSTKSLPLKATVLKTACATGTVVTTATKIIVAAPQTTISRLDNNPKRKSGSRSKCRFAARKAWPSIQVTKATVCAFASPAPLPKYARVSKAASLQNIPRAPYGLESSAVIDPPQSVPSPRRVAWLLSRPAEELNDEDRRYLGRLFELSPEIERAQSLAQRFISLMRERKSEDFDAWLREAEHSGVAEMKALAKGLKQDYAAVKAGLTYEWSNGQVEGQINRLKSVKRTMFGRANFDLLRPRTLRAA